MSIKCVSPPATFLIVAKVDRNICEVQGRTSKFVVGVALVLALPSVQVTGCQKETVVPTEGPSNSRASLPIVGFVILSHGPPPQLMRLLEAINREYDNPPIVCHHDFGQTPLDITAFGTNLAFVQPHVATSWGRFSVVKAALSALRLLYERSPDWFVLLSTSDYPIMPGREVRRIFAAAPYDAYVDARSVNECAVGNDSNGHFQNPKLSQFNTRKNKELKKKFYTSIQFWVPIIRFKPRLRLGRFTFRPGWKVNGIYANWPCFYGDHWFCANSATAKLLLEPTKKHLALRRHLRYRTHADETYFQTVIMNEPRLNICRDNKRFAEWNGGGAHPIHLNEQHLDEMLTSGAFFARKFTLNSSVLDRLDEVLGEYQ